MRLIDADAIKLPKGFFEKVDNVPKFYDWLDEQPTIDAVPVVRCKECVHQTKFWHNDGRMKNVGYYIYGCDLVDGYSHVCLDDDFCSCGVAVVGGDVDIITVDADELVVE